MTIPGCVAAAALIPTLLPGLAALPPGASQAIAPALLEGGKVHLQNDLQAQRDAMRIFREFRRDMRMIDRFEYVDDEEDAAFVALLTTSTNFVQNRSLIDTGGHIGRLASGTAMYLVIYERASRSIAWLDAVAWETRTNSSKAKSTTLLARRLRGALEQGSR